jgi:curved DNA-binding protein CbpA
MYQSSRAAQPRRRYNDLYAKLGISPNASPQEIQAAYRVLKKAYCPGGTYTDDVMHQAFLEISNAAVILGNPRKRKLYDLNYIDEAGKLTQSGLAHATRARKAAIFGVASIAVIAGLLILNFGGPAPGINRKSVQTGPQPLKVAAAEPQPSAVSPSPEPDTKTGTHKPGNESAGIGAPTEASAQDYLPPAAVLMHKSDASSAPDQPIQEPSQPRRHTSRHYSHAPGPARPAGRLAQSIERGRKAGSSTEVAPEIWGQDIEFHEPFNRGQIATSDSPALKTAQCLACLTDDRANCSGACP